jgi:hypothetical protein
MEAAVMTSGAGIDLCALSRVLGYAAAETLCWERWQGPHADDGRERRWLPAVEQDAATWARDNGLIGDELGTVAGVVYCHLTARGRACLDALDAGRR